MSAKKKSAKTWNPVIALNHKARHDYEVVETLEVGIVLLGTEVKSLRAGHLTFKDSYAMIRDGELWLYHLHINEYKQGNRFNHDPERPRKLLAHKREIERLHDKVKMLRFTLIPLKFYFKGNKVKIELGLCRGKTDIDRRETLKERDAKRQIEQAMKYRDR